MIAAKRPVLLEVTDEDGHPHLLEIDRPQLMNNILMDAATHRAYRLSVARAVHPARTHTK